MNWFFKRLSEPSSAAGAASAVQGAAMLASGANPYVAAATILGGAIAFMVKEKGYN